jgi:hypothetical protein
VQSAWTHLPYASSTVAGGVLLSFILVRFELDNDPTLEAWCSEGKRMNFRGYVIRYRADRLKSSCDCKGCNNFVQRGCVKE